MAFIWGGVLWDWTGLEFGFSSKEGQIWPNFEQVLVWIILLVLCVRGTVFFFAYFPRNPPLFGDLQSMEQHFSNCEKYMRIVFVLYPLHLLCSSFKTEFIPPPIVLSHVYGSLFLQLEVGTWWHDLSASHSTSFHCPMCPPPNTNSNPLALLDWHSAISFAQ